MEKRAVIEEGRTPVEEKEICKGEKQAGVDLEDHLTKRASDTVKDGLSPFVRRVKDMVKG